jgi:predicted DNA-binding antitoxin AbrB/MazE fold protein
MSITAVVENGSVKLPKDIPWKNGTVVRVEPVEEEQLPPLSEMLKEFDGMADDLPTDLAENLDHYIHGHRRK